MAKTEHPDDLLSTYEALEYRKKIGKKTTLITLEKAVKGVDSKGKPLPPKRVLKPARRFQVAAPSKDDKIRWFSVFTRRSLEEWDPRTRDTDAPIRNAAAFLGITPEQAQAIKTGKVRLIVADADSE